MDSRVQNQSTEEFYNTGKETNCFRYISNICTISEKLCHKVQSIIDFDTILLYKLLYTKVCINRTLNNPESCTN